MSFCFFCFLYVELLYLSFIVKLELIWLLFMSVCQYEMWAVAFEVEFELFYDKVSIFFTFLWGFFFFAFLKMTFSISVVLFLMIWWLKFFIWALFCIYITFYLFYNFSLKAWFYFWNSGLIFKVWLMPLVDLLTILTRELGLFSQNRESLHFSKLLLNSCFYCV